MVDKQSWTDILGQLDRQLLEKTKNLGQQKTAQSMQVLQEWYQTARNQRVRLAVTGLSRSGKTVFITSLLNQLLMADQQRHRLPRLQAIKDGRYLGAQEAQQPDSTIPTFRYGDHLEWLVEQGQWPESTSDISQIRLHIRTQPSGFFDSRWRKYNDLYLDIVDYPGEWLVDLGMLELDFEQWSRQLFEQCEREPLRSLAADWLQFMHQHNDGEACDRRDLEQAHALFKEYLLAAKARGYNYLQPGRVVLPGQLQGSPAVTFCPCLPPASASPRSLYHQAAERFEMYKNDVIKPFYQRHFARFDRQVVLVDLMYSLQQGKAHFDDSQKTLNALLASFQHGRSNLLSRLFSPQIDRLLFAVTKVDQVNSDQTANLQKLLAAMVLPSAKRAWFADLETLTLGLAAVRTTEAVIDHGDDGQAREFIRGQLSADDRTEPAKELHYPPGAIPDTLPDAQTWQQQPFEFHAFHPPQQLLENDLSLPHINMDKAIEFLIGDKL